MRKRSATQRTEGGTFRDHFSSVANRYAEFRPRYPEALFDYLATVTPQRSVVWDCACGNGQASVALAQRFDRVLATDASREQIASAMPHPNIEYRVALAERSKLPTGAADLVTVAQALHWFDPGRFFAEAERVMRPEGILAVWAYGINEVEGEDVNSLVREFYSGTVGPYWPPERKLVEEGYRSLIFPFAEIAPPTFRMEALWTLDQLMGYFSTWSATNRYVEATGQSPLPALRSALTSVWGDVLLQRRIVWPLSLRLGRRL